MKKPEQVEASAGAVGRNLPTEESTAEEGNPRIGTYRTGSGLVR